MPGRHKTQTLSIRLPDAERRRLDDAAARLDISRNKLVTDAIGRELDRLAAQCGADDNL